MLITIVCLSKARAGDVAALRITGAAVDATGQSNLDIMNQGVSNVSAFSVRFPSGNTFIEEFLPPEQAGIPPGSTYKFKLPPESSPNRTQVDANAYVITAVVYADGSLEGEAQDLTRIKSLRAGREYGLKRILGILGTLRASPNETFAEDLREAMNTIKSTEITREDGTQAVGLYANGMRNAANISLFRMQRIAVAMQSSADVSPSRRLLDALIADHNLKLQALAIPMTTK